MDHVGRDKDRYAETRLVHGHALDLIAQSRAFLLDHPDAHTPCANGVGIFRRETGAGVTRLQLTNLFIQSHPREEIGDAGLDGKSDVAVSSGRVGSGVRHQGGGRVLRGCRRGERSEEDCRA